MEPDEHLEAVYEDANGGAVEQEFYDDEEGVCSGCDEYEEDCTCDEDEDEDDEEEGDDE